MKKFKFTLQKVLELKEQLLKNLKSELGILQVELQEIEKQIAELLEKNKDTEIEYNEKVAKSLTAGQVSYYRLYMNTLLKKAEKKEIEKEVLKTRIEEKKTEVIAMNIEISSLEKLKDKKLEIYQKDLAKSEELFIEEFISTRKAMQGAAYVG